MSGGDMDDRGWTPLHIVARKGDLKEVLFYFFFLCCIFYYLCFYSVSCYLCVRCTSLFLVAVLLDDCFST